ncbi:hypothetical protein B0H13DRAFT_2121139, partial [Mycena leptocephala]
MWKRRKGSKLRPWTFMLERGQSITKVLGEITRSQPTVGSRFVDVITRSLDLSLKTRGLLSKKYRFLMLVFSYIMLPTANSFAHRASGIAGGATLAIRDTLFFAGIVTTRRPCRALKSVSHACASPSQCVRIPPHAAPRSGYRGASAAART